MAPFASLARGLAALILVTLYSEMSANRQEFQEDDWTFYIISAGICAFLAARAPRPTARRTHPRAPPPPRAPRPGRARAAATTPRFPQAYGIGANDVANAFATSVGSKAITVKQAVMIASVFEFLGAVLMGSNVSKTIRKGIADVGCFEANPGLLIYGMTCVIISVGIWLILASYLEMPVSTTHSCVGGIIGMTLMTRGKGCVIWNYTRNDYGNGTTNMAFENFPWLDGVAEIVVSWVLSPVASGCCAAALYGLCRLTVLRAENAYWRAKVSFPVIVGATFAINSCYWIVKGTKGQPERFGTAGLVREAKAGNLVPTIVIGCYVGLAAAACAAASLPYITKQIEAEGDLAAVPDDDVEATAADAECKTPPKDDEVREATKEGGVDVAGYVKGALAKDQFAVLQTDEKVGAIHANLERHDVKAEAFFRYVQVFTATVDAFSHGANDVANAMGPFAAAYVAYKKGKVVKAQEMNEGTMAWILALGGAGIVVGLATYGYKIMRAMGVKLTAITPSRGSCIELGAAFVIIYGTGQGWPLSTTHCQIGATVAVGLFEGVGGVNVKLFAKTCFGWIITLVVVGCTTAMLVGPSPEPLKGEYCDNYAEVKYN